MNESAIPYLIIGGGPTGLGAASRLQELGVPWRLLEKGSHVGGLASSYAVDGFTWDCGTHVLFSHYPQFDRLLDEILSPEEWGTYRRASHVRTCQRWIPYPFQYNIGALPPNEKQACLEGLMRLQSQGSPPDRSSFQAFIETQFGAGIASLFMLPYNRKAWAYPLDQMNTAWLGERVPPIDLAKVTAAQRPAEEDSSWGPNNSFRYPLMGGTGEIWKRLARRLPAEQIFLDREVARISPSARTVTLRDGRVLHYGRLISTMPLDLLVEMADLESLRPQSRLLKHTSTNVIGLGVRMPIPQKIRKFSWMYFPDGDCVFHRATVLSSYSPHGATPGRWSLMLEVSDSAFRRIDSDGLIRACVNGCLATGLIENEEDIVHQWQHREEYGYPVPSHERDRAVEALLAELETLNIFSRGRFGAWKYEVGNMDHSFMQGVEVADRVALGSEEVTVWNPDRVNRVTGS